jgi:hypothetical protein
MPVVVYTHQSQLPATQIRRRTYLSATFSRVIHFANAVYDTFTYGFLLAIFSENEWIVDTPRCRVLGETIPDKRSEILLCLRRTRNLYFLDINLKFPRNGHNIMFPDINRLHKGIPIMMISRLVNPTLPNKYISLENHLPTRTRFSLLLHQYGETSPIVVLGATDRDPFSATSDFCYVRVVDVNYSVETDPVFAGVGYWGGPLDVDWGAEGEA